MKITNEIKKAAASVFDTVEVDELFVNSKGHFFKNKNMAELSEKNKKNIALIRRSDVISDEENTDAKEKATKEAKEKAGEIPTVDQLKAMAELPSYLNGLKRDGLFAISEMIGVKVAGNVTNAKFAEALLKELTKEA